MTLYTTVGSVRGCCQHLHRSESAAEECVRDDADGCATQGGYSDRRVVSDYTYSEGCAMSERVRDALRAQNKPDVALGSDDGGGEVAS